MLELRAEEVQAPTSEARSSLRFQRPEQPPEGAMLARDFNVLLQLAACKQRARGLWSGRLF
jgi:hypothetical protein